MKDHINYAKYVLRHKWFVFRARRLTGASLWRVLVHDLSKLLPSEWTPYVRTFYEPDGSRRYEETPAFDEAWKHHQNRNKHHWQYWVLTRDEGGAKTLEMPEQYVREMVADWVGAGAAQGKFGTFGWYNVNRGKMMLHPRTRKAVENLMAWVRIVEREYEQQISEDPYRPMPDSIRLTMDRIFRGEL